ncbi:MAG TPA: adenylyltransferase/cytidyltransferase family protein [Ruminococcus bromii]|nr:adenylyltransferase/cytidyltransferase family protein [Ruminococcus bromii]
MKTGIFGGTFNPVHKGHIMLAEYCMDSVGLDRIIMIPTAVSAAQNKQESCKRKRSP